METQNTQFKQLNETKELYNNQQIENQIIQNKDVDSFQEEIQEDSHDNTCYESCLTCLGHCSGFCRMCLPCLCCWCPHPYVLVRQFQQGLLQKFGRYKMKLEAGYHKINPFVERVIIINKKTQILDLYKQVILTKDNLCILIDAVVYYRISDPKKSSYKVVDVQTSVKEVSYAALRTIMGEFTLQDILEKREKVQNQLKEFLFKHIEEWGVYISEVLIKDMIISPELQQSLSMAIKTKRLGECKIISAKADVETAKLLREAADILDCEAAMQIRYFDTINEISGVPCEKVLFLPINENSQKQQHQQKNYQQQQFSYQQQQFPQQNQFIQLQQKQQQAMQIQQQTSQIQNLEEFHHQQQLLLKQEQIKQQQDLFQQQLLQKQSQQQNQVSIEVKQSDQSLEKVKDNSNNQNNQ